MKGRPPGMVRVGVDPDVVMMICTAGHVDHGKTSLVKLLTGCNTDRLKIEQERGMTIELGFAPCLLGGDLCVGIVDVPGHEKFVRNMVAGVSGIDLTILVIAADDGIMPQTIEHSQIMELLGVRQGIIAVTKIDLVAPERVDEVHRQIRASFKDTFLAAAPICPLSSETGDGIFDFYETLVARIRGIEKQRRRGVFRMPVERVFPQKGFGLVTTGIAIDGEVAVGDEIEVVPGGQCGKVRAIQQFLRNKTSGGYGQCLALNIPEFSKAPLRRGQVLCRPGWLKPAREFYGRVKTVTGLSQPVTHAETLKIHTGTSEVMGRIFLLEGKTLGPNAAAFASISLAEPVAVAIHDRFILRRPSPATTVGGGEVMLMPSERVPKRKSELLEYLASYHEQLRDIDPSTDEGIRRDIEFALRARWPCGAAIEELARDLLVSETALRDMERPRKVLALEPNLLIHEEVYDARLNEAQSRLKAAEETRTLSLTVAELRQSFPEWPAPLWAKVQADLEQQGMAVRGSRVVLRNAFDRLPAPDRALAERLIHIYDETRFESPRPDELPGMVHAPEQSVDRLLNYLCSDGSLVRLAKNVVLSRNAYKQAQDAAVNIIRERGALDSADFKYAIGSTRKYALAILDYLDARRVTVRTDNLRRLAPDYERRLI